MSLDSYLQVCVNPGEYLQVIVLKCWILSHDLWQRQGSRVTAAVGLRLQDGGGVSLVGVSF